MARKRRTGIFYGWVIVAAGCLILFLHFGFQYTYGVFFTELCDDLHWSRAMVSGAYSLFMFWHSIICLGAGRLNDRRGPQLTIAICIIALTIGYALMSTVNTPWQIYIFYGIIIGTGAGFAYVPVTSTVSRWFIRRRGTALGITVAGVGLGTLALAPFAQFLISRLDWRSSYLVIAGILLIVGLPVSRLMRLRPSEKGLFPDGVDQMAEEGVEHNKSSCVLDFTLKQAIKTRPFWLLFAIYVFLMFALEMVMVHLKAYATDVGISPMTATTILGVVGGVSILGRIAIGSVSDKIGRKASFFICFLLMAVMMLWLLRARQPWQFYLFSAIFGFGYGGCMPLFPAVTADWFGTKYHGTIFGTMSLAPGIGGAIGPLLGGYVFDITGSYNIAIIAGAVILFIAASCSFALKAPSVKST
jgi:MFS family permease